MLNVFNLQNKSNLNANQPSGNSWLQLTNPNKGDIDKLKESFLIPDFLLDIHNQNKIKTTLNRYNDLFYFTIEIPVSNKQDAENLFNITKIAIIIVDNSIITISKVEHPIFEILKNEYNDSSINLSVSGLVYRIFELANQLFLNAFSEINNAVDSIERKLKISIKNNLLFNLLYNNKSYLYLINSLKKNNVILKEITNKRLFSADYKTNIQIMDIEITSQQLYRKIEIFQANLRNLMDAYSASIENNLSLAVQYLTVFVTIASIPLAVAGIYGMNTPLPFQEKSYALLLLTGITFTVTAVMIGLFKIRRVI